jgi:hypothetical protein
MPTPDRWQFSLRTLLLTAVPIAVALAVSRLARAGELWIALGESFGYFGGFGIVGALIGHLTGRRDGAIDGAAFGLLGATLIFFALVICGW